MVTWQGFVVVVGTSALVISCGGDDKAPDSTVQSGGSGGMAGSGGALLLGKGGSMPGAGGTAPLDTGPPPSITFHTCGMPEPSCSPKPLTGDVVLDGPEDLAALQGVTTIEGSLSISLKMADTLNCLESVDGDVSINVSEVGSDASLWGLRHLKSIGGNLEISNTSERTYADCGLSELERVGSVDGGRIAATDLGGELDVSRLQALRELDVSSTELIHIKLPASGPISLARLEIANNQYLNQISGFDEVMVQPLVANTAETVRIVNNPRLSECVADKLGQRFVSGGAAPSSITKFGNLPCPSE